ncbi:hypothetical protein [Geopseudomonas aromaticivorans]
MQYGSHHVLVSAAPSRRFNAWLGKAVLAAALCAAMTEPASAGVVGTVAKVLGAEVAADVVIDQATKAFKSDEKVYGAEMAPKLRAHHEAWLKRYVAEENRTLPHTTPTGDIRAERLSIGPGLVMNSHLTMLDRDSRKKVMHPLDDGFLKSMKQYRCSLPKWRKMLEAGIAIRDFFNSADGKQLKVVTYDADVCDL